MNNEKCITNHQSRLKKYIFCSHNYHWIRNKFIAFFYSVCKIPSSAFLHIFFSVWEKATYIACFNKRAAIEKGCLFKNSCCLQISIRRSQIFAPKKKDAYFPFWRITHFFWCCYYFGRPKHTIAQSGPSMRQ